MPKKLKDLAKLVGGDLVGDGNLQITGVSPLDSAKPGDITFATDSGTLAEADSSCAAAVVAPLKTKPKKPAILVGKPRLAMARILGLYKTQGRREKGIHKTVSSGRGVKTGPDVSVGAFSTLSDNVKIGDGTLVHPHVFIGERSEIGKGCVIYPNVTIYDNVKIGNNVIIHAGTVIGVDGFGFEQEAGRHVKIPQIGGVIIEDDVEVFANATIARGTMDSTLIKRGTKIDCLSHIAHNSVVGEDCALAAGVELAGSVVLMDRVFVGGQAAFNNRVTVGENSVVMAKTGVTKDFPANSVISGFPAHEHKKELEIQALLRRLPQLIKKLLK